VTIRSLAPALALVLALGATTLRAEDPPTTARVPLEGQARADLLTRIEARMSALRSFVAHFEQEKSLAIFQDTLSSSGFIAFAQPSDMRWEIREPFRSLLIVSGGRAAKFEWVDGQRRTLALGRGGDVVAAVMGRIEGWFRGDFGRQTDFDMVVFEAPTPAISLRPKVASMARGLSTIEIDLAPDLASIERVTIHETSGDRTVMRYRLLARDAAFPAGTFSTTDPIDLDPERFRPSAPSATSAPSTPTTPSAPSGTSAPEER